MEEKSAPPFALPSPAQDDILDVETDPLVGPEEEEIEKETNAISSSSSIVCFWLQIYKPPRHLVLDRSQLQGAGRPEGHYLLVDGAGRSGSDTYIVTAQQISDDRRKFTTTLARIPCSFLAWHRFSMSSILTPQVARPEANCDPIMHVHLIIIDRDLGRLG
jgi:hypothetical protein